MHFKENELKKWMPQAPTGILHVGAHLAEERETYDKLGVKRVIWIEGNPKVFPELARRIAEVPGYSAYNILASDVHESANLYVTNASQSSSLLPLGTHKFHHPQITLSETIPLETWRLDEFIEQKGVDFTGINCINLDIQGSELKALKGTGKLLEQIDYIYSEVSIAHVYEGGALMSELDEYLLDRGFKRVMTFINVAQWGDALYVRQATTPTQRKLLVLGTKLHQFFGNWYVLRRYFVRALRKIVPKKRVD